MVDLVAEAAVGGADAGQLSTFKRTRPAFVRRWPCKFSLSQLNAESTFIELQLKFGRKAYARNASFQASGNKLSGYKLPSAKFIAFNADQSTNVRLTKVLGARNSFRVRALVALPFETI